MDKRQAKKTALKARLLDAARETIAMHGLGALRARDLAEKAGCATGSVYNVFSDLDDLILQANAQTIVELGVALSIANKEKSPEEKLEALALAYCHFAQENRALWEALFQHRMADGGPSPDWFLTGHTILLDQIAQPLKDLAPELSATDLQRRARTYFAAVHGIISIALQDRFIGLPREKLEDELSTFVKQLTLGVSARQV